MSDVTRILNEIAEGQRQPGAELLPLVYDELRRLAEKQMLREKPGQTLSATALVHEAFLRLTGDGDPPRWESRIHFLRAAAESMRRILIDRARSKQTQKRGGHFQRIDLDAGLFVDDQTYTQLIDLNEALDALKLDDEAVADLVMLRFFAGMTVDEAAKLLNIAPRTADAWWSYGRAFLARRIMEKHKDS